MLENSENPVAPQRAAWVSKFLRKIAWERALRNTYFCPDSPIIVDVLDGKLL